MTVQNGQPRVIGLDLSLSSTGVASSLGWCERIRVPAQHGQLERLRAIRQRVIDFARGYDLVVVEGPSYGSGTSGRQAGHHSRAGLWWLVVEAIDARGIRWLEVPPATLKKYATGRGNAGKDDMLTAAVRRFPAVAVSGNDEADALWLAAIGAELMGKPMVDLPANQKEALVKLRLPARMGGALS